MIHLSKKQNHKNQFQSNIKQNLTICESLKRKTVLLPKKKKTNIIQLID